MMNFKKITFSFLAPSFLAFAMIALLAAPLLAGPASSPKSASGDDGLDFAKRPNSYFHVQGVCNFDTGPLPALCPQAKTERTDLCVSTWTCQGDGKDMLRATYKNGLEVCAYLDNTSGTSSKGYFVPMNTAEEWLAFGSAVNTPADVKVVVGCPGGVEEDSCGNKYNVPDVRVSDNPNDVQRFSTTGDYSVSFFCPATLKTRNPQTGVETSQPVVNCGGWQKTEVGTCVNAAGLTFNGFACSKQSKGAEFVVVLDASASMDQLLSGAQNALRSVITKYLAARSDIPVTVTVIGGDGYVNPLSDPSKQNCPYGKLFGPLAANANAINTVVDNVAANNNTPIDTTLRYSANFFQDFSKRHVMLVLSDGYETCYGDAAFATQQLRDKGIEIYGIKYGDGTDEPAVNFFKAMNKYSAANSQAEILTAVEDVVKDITDEACKPVLRLYTPGASTTSAPLYTVLSGQTSQVKRGTYDAVVDYCTGTQLFPNQIVQTDRGFDFNQNCTK